LRGTRYLLSAGSIALAVGSVGVISALANRDDVQPVSTAASAIETPVALVETVDLPVQGEICGANGLCIEARGASPEIEIIGSVDGAKVGSFTTDACTIASAGYAISGMGRELEDGYAVFGIVPTEAKPTTIEGVDLRQLRLSLQDGSLVQVGYGTSETNQVDAFVNAFQDISVAHTPTSNPPACEALREANAKMRQDEGVGDAQDH
jgi:hypothetical protein